MYSKLLATGIALAAFVTQAVGAAACGGLVAPNGAIRLTRATTYVDWRDGVEHYFTSFAYAGTDVSDFGWIVPLPVAPDKVEEGGGWTLQRLNRETHPQLLFATAGSAFDSRAAAPAPAEILLTTKVRALDITVLRGTGQAIVEWCRQNSFLLTPETKAHLQVYAHGSPVFMAAKYNAERATATRQVSGDGAPVLITMHIPHPWVPLEVLANGTDHVAADLYITTDQPLYSSDFAAALRDTATGDFIAGAPGLSVEYQQPVSEALHRDLSSDKNMSWLRPGGWLTYLKLDAPAQTVTYDLGISSSGVIRVAPYGTVPMKVADFHRRVPLVTYERGLLNVNGGARAMSIAFALLATLLALGLWTRRALRLRR
jgi:hypothetical protein